jgi:hypothetical protein
MRKRELFASRWGIIFAVCLGGFAYSLLLSSKNK